MRWLARSIAACPAALALAWGATAAAQAPVDAATGAGPADRSEGSGESSVGFEVGLYGGVFMPDEAHEFYDWRTVSQQPLEPVGPVFGLRLAIFPLRILGLEGEADLMPTLTESGADVLLYGTRAHLILQIPARVSPFVLGGIGTIGVRSQDDELGSDADLIGHVGLGVKVRLDRRLDLRAEGRLFRGPEAGSDARTSHFAALLGISARFGGAVQQTARTDRSSGSGQVATGRPAPDTRGEGGVETPSQRSGVADTDGDRIADAVDRCPLEPGPPSSGGCPDADRDRDGVADAIDNCPDQAGRADYQGCGEPQLVAIRDGRLRLREPIIFRTNRSVIRRGSRHTLDNLAAVLISHPKIGLVRIAGHTDDRGDTLYNEHLSLRRAEQVRKYLLERGVAPERLQAVGYGEAQPIESNSKAAGRARNRRVEFEVAIPAAN